MLSRIERNTIPEPNSGCLIWLGAASDGYGTIRVGGRVEKVHRVVYRETRGSIPLGMCVLHHCDNPPCCNPDHLFLGTKLDNTRDCKKKGRLYDRRGIGNPRAKLTPEQVLQIRSETGRDEDIAARYGVSTALICKIQRRELWKHL